MWKSQFPNKSGTENVNNLPTSAAVASYLAEHFGNACKPNDENKNVQFFAEYADEKLKLNDHDSFIEVSNEMVDNSVRNMKGNKASGSDGLTIEFF